MDQGLAVVAIVEGLLGGAIVALGVWTIILWRRIQRVGVRIEAVPQIMNEVARLLRDMPRDRGAEAARPDLDIAFPDVPEDDAVLSRLFDPEPETDQMVPEVPTYTLKLLEEEQLVPPKPPTPRTSFERILDEDD